MERGTMKCEWPSDKQAFRQRIGGMIMATEKTSEARISAYMSHALHSYFGKGPTSVYVTLKYSFITIHCRGMNSPMEKLLLKQGEWQRVLQTRDLVIQDMKAEIIQELQEKAGLCILKLFADWNLQEESGIFSGVMEPDPNEDNFPGLGKRSGMAWWKKGKQA
jgi:uncharacterized protein YbcI